MDKSTVLRHVGHSQHQPKRRPMPELPEVETTRRGLEPHLTGQRITAITLRRQDLRQPITPGFARALTQATITGIRRRAKYLLFDFDRPVLMLAHLGMSGSLRFEMQSQYRPRTHDHAIFALSNGACLVFHDPRRFGLLLHLPANHEAQHPLLAALGPEPLSDDFTPQGMAAALARRSGALKPVLMDQKLVVGVGNIYASESLYLCRLNPMMPASRAAPHAAALVTAIRDTLRAAIDSGGSSLRDYLQPGGDAGQFQHHFHVYDRAGQPCQNCGEKIHHAVQAARSTYWCPRCQAMPKKRRKT